MNDINEMPPKCQYCPRWEVCEYPWVCPDIGDKKPKCMDERTETHACDLIDRQMVIDAVTPFDDEYRIRDAIEDLPSAQPKIIRCRECKEWEMYGNGCQGWCGKLGLISYDDDYCGWAERREVSE